MPVNISIKKEYTAAQEALANRKELYSAMIIYGLLSYHGEVISTPKTAIRQIKEKEYCEKLLNEGVENILLTGISYDTVKKIHQCKIGKFRSKIQMHHNILPYLFRFPLRPHIRIWMR